MMARADCADCGRGAVVDVKVMLDLASLRADLASGARKVVCGRYLQGGPAVVTVVASGAAAFASLGADEGLVDDAPEVVTAVAPPTVKGLPLVKACEVAGIACPRTKAAI